MDAAPVADPSHYSLDETLILMACSSKKKPLAAGVEVPLMHLYDGPMWQTLRKALQGRDAHVVVLSGKFGFISAGAYAATYEARLSSSRADHLISRGIDARQDRFGELRKILDVSPLCELKRPARPTQTPIRLPWAAVIMAGGGEYRRVFTHMLGQLRDMGELAPNAPVFMTTGGIGMQRSQLGRYVAALRRE